MAVVTRITRLGRALAYAAAVTLLLPAPALAADPPTVKSGESATLLVILLLASLTAGLFFASPLRRRLERIAAAPARRARKDGSSRLARAATALVRLRRPIDRLLDQLGAWIAARGRHVRPMYTARPLPRMPGGDIFFDDTPATVEPPSSTGRLSDERDRPAR